MSFSNTLKDLLNENNISQSRLASAIGFSQRAISKWINAQSEPTEKAITLCAEYFGVSADYLLGLSDDLGAPIPAPPPALPADEKELLDLYYIIVKRACQRKKHFRKEVLFLRLWSLIFSGVLSRNNRTPRQRAKSPYHCTAHNSTRARGRLPSSLPATTLAPARTPAPPVQALCP